MTTVCHFEWNVLQLMPQATVRNSFRLGQCAIGFLSKGVAMSADDTNEYEIFEGRSTVLPLLGERAGVRANVPSIFTVEGRDEGDLQSNFVRLSDSLKKTLSLTPPSPQGEGEPSNVLVVTLRPLDSSPSVNSTENSETP